MQIFRLNIRKKLSKWFEDPLVSLLVSLKISPSVITSIGLLVKNLITDLVFTEATEFIVAPAVFLHPLAGLKFAVAPGFIQTNMTDKIEESMKSNLISRIPMSKLGTGEDVANTVAFLSSDAASYITGETIHVNGGMYFS